MRAFLFPSDIKTQFIETLVMSILFYKYKPLVQESVYDWCDTRQMDPIEQKESEFHHFYKILIGK